MRDPHFSKNEMAEQSSLSTELELFGNDSSSSENDEVGDDEISIDSVLLGSKRRAEALLVKRLEEFQPQEPQVSPSSSMEDEICKIALIIFHFIV